MYALPNARNEHLQQGLRTLCSLTYRGGTNGTAVAEDGTTKIKGDGCGLKTSYEGDFFETKANQAGVSENPKLKESVSAGVRGIGMIQFTGRAKEGIEDYKEKIIQLADQFNIEILGWADPQVNMDALPDDISRNNAPHIVQPIFIAKYPNTTTIDIFRQDTRRFTYFCETSFLKDGVSVESFDDYSLTYSALCTPQQLPIFYHEDFSSLKSAVATFHQRYSTVNVK